MEVAWAGAFGPEPLEFVVLGGELGQCAGLEFGELGDAGVAAGQALPESLDVVFEAGDPVVARSVTWPAARACARRRPKSYDHLREVTRDDVLDYLAGLRGDPRRDALAALRSLFTWAKRDGVIFANPATRIRIGARPLPVWQPLTTDETTSAVQAATTPQARLCVALAAVHAARPGQIHALLTSDVDLGDRRITIAGRRRPLDDLTRRLLTEWLDYRRARWPRTTNPHLLISRESALHHGPVSAVWIRDLRGLPATLERLRIDQQLEEALACDGDPQHIAAVFDIDTSTAIRYAANARQLLDHAHAARLSASPATRVPGPGSAADGYPGSR